jgi:ribosomal protein S18 acetylase RimI-like enzyme
MIRYATVFDKETWFMLDRHLPKEEFEDKTRKKQCYVLQDGEKTVGILRYNLFWDNTPFCTMLYVEKDHRGRGFGKELMDFWENDMKSKGYGMVMTSTQENESAQHFYRKLGYRDCGSFDVNVPGYEQPTELIMIKVI